MSEDLEKTLRAALRPLDPGDAFADAVMARVRAERPVPVGLRWWRWAPAWRWASVLAAMSCVALLLVQSLEAHHARQGLEARQALMQALRVTGQSLDLADRAVNEGGGARQGSDPGV